MMTSESFKNWLKLPEMQFNAPISQEGIGLCLSGGGFKACLYHLGAIIRLNELGILRGVEVISSVSGGAIAGAWLSLVWDKLVVDPETQNFDQDCLINTFVRPVYELATRHALGNSAFLKGLLPFKNRSQNLSNEYARHLFEGAKLSDMPETKTAPKFVFTAACARTNQPWRFSKDSAECSYIGRIIDPPFLMADIVAASSAFPLMLDPLTLDLSHVQWDKNYQAPFHTRPYTQNTILRDGGIVDNFGLTPAVSTCEIILVSDASTPFIIKENPKFIGFNFKRTAGSIASHGEASRINRLHEMAKRKERAVLFWRLSQNPKHLSNSQFASLKAEDVHKIITIKMSLNRYTPHNAKMLINHGYNMCTYIFEDYGLDYGFEETAKTTNHLRSLN